ncbi:MAG: alpha amylase C-terminal domain-containing protein [Lentisphaeria bacterium]|nr:alpha amylase C-terminal domain-containing protein [Lentisphaeria bacterium]
MNCCDLPWLNERTSLNSDPHLQPYYKKLEARHRKAQEKIRELAGDIANLKDFASAHEYYGLHKKSDCWIFREWAPHADAIYLCGDFSDWEICHEYKLQKINSHGDWEIKLPLETLKHEMHYNLQIKFNGRFHSRLDAYARFTVQNEETKIFSSLIWDPSEKYQFKYDNCTKSADFPFIYECHTGMAQEEAKIGTFREFIDKTLPRIVKSGYNMIQLMAVMNHPYYGSFGYHAANFFSISSRFGNPEEFKELVDSAHKYGLKVIIDLVHSHSVRNEAEGLGNFDGRRDLYFLNGEAGIHPAWDSLCFDYGKNEVLHFLLSNCRFYLDEYHIDGFRFDGVTSMIYHDHGLNRIFNSYHDYFTDNTNEDALTYLTLANTVIHQLNPDAVTIAEDVSGMPGLAAPFNENGIGFDYRLAMGVTDMWFKVFDIPDEQWDMFYIFNEVTNSRKDENSISYVECHDQSIVGGQTAIFRLIGNDMYDFMSKFRHSVNVDRGIALHKLARLLTFCCCRSGYLNFMGNEFGHPEWIDFPREGNNWSLHYARRQWSLADDTTLHYGGLAKFDRAMLKLEQSYGFLKHKTVTLNTDNERKIIAFARGGLFFFFNFNPIQSFENHKFNVLNGEYELVLSSDAAEYGGFDRVQTPQTFYAVEQKDGQNATPELSLYLPSRSALILARKNLL